MATNGTSRRSLADFSAVSSRSNQAVLVSCKPWGNMSSLISILKSSQILYQNWAVPSEHTSLWKLVPCKNPNPLWKNVSYSNHSVAVSRFATSQISLLKNIPISNKVHGMITQQLFQALTIPPAASEWKALVLDWKSFIVGRQNAIVARLLSSPWFENIFFRMSASAHWYHQLFEKLPSRPYHHHHHLIHHLQKHCLRNYLLLKAQNMPHNTTNSIIMTRVTMTSAFWPV